jgi:membrane fusion protein, copper/silver efflux system
MKNFILGFVVAAALLAGSYWAYSRWGGKMATGADQLTDIKYQCPMHPTYISDEPGNCPICGMELVPIKPPASLDSQKTGLENGMADMAGMPSDQPAASESEVPGYAPVMIPQDRIQSMGITFAEARRMELDQSFRTFGRITYDETRIHHLHTKFEGYIEALYANYVGQFVKQGAPLFSIYSPELYATQNEYLLALRARQQVPPVSGDDAFPAVGNVDLVAAARQRLTLWDIGDDDIRELERTGKAIRALTIYAPVSGYVLQKTALQGLKVMPADNLYDIVDLSTVWVLADIYEVNLSLVRLGQPASITLAYQPGKTWRGRVAFINPTVDPATRTVKARLEFANPDNELKPDMYADVVIGGARATGIAVPESAVIATGERNIVFVAMGNGLFEPREVTLGAQVRNLYEIKQGVSEGERVVTGANFLLDSESKLKASVSGMVGEHKHGQ